MNKIFTCLSIFLFSFTHGYSQQLFTTAGTQQNNVSWSIGEIVTESGTMSGVTISQGFNSYLNLLPTGISDITSSIIKAYPNPVIDKLFLKFTDGNSYSYTITDIVGRVLLNKTVQFRPGN